MRSVEESRRSNNETILSKWWLLTREHPSCSLFALSVSLRIISYFFEYKICLLCSDIFSARGEEEKEAIKSATSWQTRSQKRAVLFYSRANGADERVR